MPGMERKVLVPTMEGTGRRRKQKEVGNVRKVLATTRKYIASN